MIFLIEKLFKKLGIKANPNKVIFITLSILCGLFILTRVGIIANMLLGDPELKINFSPFMYAIAFTLAPLAFCFFVNSGIPKVDKHKVYGYIIAYVAFLLTVSTFFIQLTNQIGWTVLKLFPNYGTVRATVPQYFDQAFKSIIIVLPFVGAALIIDKILGILRNDDEVKGITGFKGLSAIYTVKDTGPFTCEVMICRDKETSIPIIVPEKKRYEATLVQGATGSGKTATILLPMSAMDLEKKYFFREYSKKTGYGLLKKGVAYIEGPYSNEYLNNNFDLSLIKPKKGKEEEFKKDVKDVFLGTNPETGEAIYKNLGITIVENDGKFISDFRNVAENFNIEVNSIDPLDPNTRSINPFAIDNPSKVASIIADVLKSMYESEGGGGAGDPFFTQVTLDAFQNLAILLKEMHPILNNGELPNLEDMLELLYNFDKVEEMTEEMKKVPELSKKYQLLIAYFERNFYKPALNINGFEIPGTRGSGRKDTERFLYGAITQLNNLLRHPGLKKALCSRNNNVDFDEALEKGEIITACSRKGELGIIQSRALGMFFILQFQDAVLRRPGNEDSRLPHFLYIDEFPEYINKDTEVMFTLFRKYRCGVTIAIQNLSQLEKQRQYAYYRQTVLANTRTQIIFGDTVPEDSAYWNQAFGKVLTMKTSYNYKTSDDGYDAEGVFKLEKSEKERFKTHKIAEMGFKKVIYKTKDLKGNTIFGEGKTDFLASKYKKKQPFATYNFEKYMVSKPAVSSYNVLSEEEDQKIFGSTFINQNDSENKSSQLKEEPVKENISIEIPHDFNIVIEDSPVKESANPIKNNDNVINMSPNNDTDLSDILKF